MLAMYYIAIFIAVFLSLPVILEDVMETSEVKRIIEAGINDCEAIVTADGSKYTAIVISDEFEGKTMVAEQKMVYALVNKHIQSGAIHALTIKAYTKSEWAELNS